MLHQPGHKNAALSLRTAAVLLDAALESFGLGLRTVEGRKPVSAVREQQLEDLILIRWADNDILVQVGLQMSMCLSSLDKATVQLPSSGC